jgi:hypothetical protein
MMKLQAAILNFFGALRARGDFSRRGLPPTDNSRKNNK